MGSICFPYQKILVLNFRIKWLDTFVLLPSNLDYSDFELRVNLTANALMVNYGLNLQEIDAEQVIKDGQVNILKVRKTEKLLKHMNIVWL